MENKNKAVEAKGTDAAGDTGVKNGSPAPTDQGVDLADELMKALEAKEKAEKDRDNYKQGLLKAKGKVDDEGDDDGLAAKIEAAVEAKLAAQKAAQSDSSVTDLTKKLIERNKELEMTIQNKPSASVTGSGGNTDTQMKVGDNMLSQAQLDHLKTARGWNDKQIERFKELLVKNSR